MLRPRTLILLLVLFLITTAVVADSTDARKNVLTFGAGAGGLIGVTYERQIIDSGTVSINANLSAGYLIFGAAFPHGVTAAVGRDHAVEAGILGTFIAVKPLSLGILGPADDGWAFAYRVRPLIGYRRQRSEGGLVIRAYFSPYIYNDNNLVENDNEADLSILPWGGVMFGFAF